MKYQGFKNRIITLRKKGYSYTKIVKLIGCSKSIVSFHCKRYGLEDIGLGNKKTENTIIEKIQEYYKNHTAKETAKTFSVSECTVKRYVSKKRKKYTNEERRLKRYGNVLDHRQKMKRKAVEYMGGKCKCGYNKSMWSLDFHHKNEDEKEYNISELCFLSWEKIKKELDKCILICKNCHGETHEKKYEDKLIELKNAGVSPHSYKV